MLLCEHDTGSRVVILLLQDDERERAESTSVVWWEISHHVSLSSIHNISFICLQFDTVAGLLRFQVSVEIHSLIKFSCRNWEKFRSSMEKGREKRASARIWMLDWLWILIQEIFLQIHKLSFDWKDREIGRRARWLDPGGWHHDDGESFKKYIIRISLQC